MPRFYLVERCVLLLEIPGVSNAKAVRFWFCFRCFYVRIQIAWHVRASSPAPTFYRYHTRSKNLVSSTVPSTQCIFMLSLAQVRVSLPDI